ncbi:precorrin-2 dehydrogenase/sirohydrochlorin ferrochelatase [Enterococcus sp. AZ194]|uniref:precorrin-2 dehydrogenase/sirohydrochlorin ferrochelatase family protein n=1 Tax=Enterococcus sp. AZ194 TaxID=2774629 RepID=UPI003F233D9C
MYPILVDLSKLTIVVIGGGQIASRKVHSLVEAGGRPLVIAPVLSKTIQELFEMGQLLVRQRAYQAGDISQAHLVFICTDDEAVNQQVMKEVRPHQLINDTTKQAHSNFFNMAFLKEAHLGLAVTTYGKNPKEAKRLKKELQAFVQKEEQRMNEESQKEEQ